MGNELGILDKLTVYELTLFKKFEELAWEARSLHQEFTRQLKKSEEINWSIYQVGHIRISHDNITLANDSGKILCSLNNSPDSIFGCLKASFLIKTNHPTTRTLSVAEKEKMENAAIVTYLLRGYVSNLKFNERYRPNI